MDSRSFEFAREWLEKSEHDRSAAYTLMKADPPLPDIAAFHCQQAFEKMFKAFLTFHGKVFEKTHDLGRLCKLCESIDSDFGIFLDRVDVYTDFAVDYRYPGVTEPEMTDVQQALTVLTEVRNFVTSRILENE